ncbi:TIGR00725 family protein [Rhodococcus sp. F64268]|uniref:TIGR00725 family protein n=1 Tax=unclassified Rhodococcus (in: high G+C Gram-positive bacteria) TaxID=192944 RepID=UPI0027E06E06|nr:TIGR00725 family protein [Rhodococcus sp. F64268]
MPCRWNPKTGDRCPFTLGVVDNPDMHSQRYVGVVGPGEATPEQRRVARQVGGLLAGRRAVVVTGGLGGVMAAASRGAIEAGGTTLGLLPDDDRVVGNPYLTVAIPTGLGEMRNALLVRSSDALVVVGGSWGTMSEIALAVRTGVPVVSIGGWKMPAGGVLDVESPEEAVECLHALLWRKDA